MPVADDNPDRCAGGSSSIVRSSRASSTNASGSDCRPPPEVTFSVGAGSSCGMRRSRKLGELYRKSFEAMLASAVPAEEDTAAVEPSGGPEDERYREKFNEDLAAQQKLMKVGRHPDQAHGRTSL
jgi:hypothetical protein